MSGVDCVNFINCILKASSVILCLFETLKIFRFSCLEIMLYFALYVCFDNKTLKIDKVHFAPVTLKTV